MHKVYNCMLPLTTTSQCVSNIPGKLSQLCNSKRQPAPSLSASSKEAKRNTKLSCGRLYLAVTIHGKNHFSFPAAVSFLFLTCSFKLCNRVSSVAYWNVPLLSPNGSFI